MIIPSEYVGKIVGSRGTTIQAIQENCNVLQITIEDQQQQSSLFNRPTDDEENNNVNLQKTSVVQIISNSYEKNEEAKAIISKSL